MRRQGEERIRGQAIYAEAWQGSRWEQNGGIVRLKRRDVLTEERSQIEPERMAQVDARSASDVSRNSTRPFRFRAVALAL